MTRTFRLERVCLSQVPCGFPCLLFIAIFVSVRHAIPGWRKQSVCWSCCYDHHVSLAVNQHYCQQNERTH
jgi:hypothetical protein